ncbi:glycogen synthase [Corynebacterium belfantii]|uniref:glycogen synthase n=1 Tax=Corynebacterium belfantii TaxID=2014537 RepID=UPI00096127C8|nr:glycogen synthase [Corynebacterium belfantii]MBG9310222.1 glycogen synthase [Corynebacterium belfantii]OLN17299.1 glycosyl transferase family 1 [Corynebacterium diphtheriae subsp. lausannense]QBZ30563.1 glycogen synthase [Corynebacterium diphtheriae subsp. lausannense]
MRVTMMTKEYPPEIYGGAGVHVAELTRHMRDIVDVDVHCMGAPRNEDNVYTYGVDPELTSANAALQTMSTGLRMAHAAAHTDVVHSHTWYTGLGGHLAGLLHEVPHIVTAHSLEPDRPWKREQLGGGYDVSSWSEQNAMEYADAVIAVSAGMKDAILRAYPRIDADKIRVVLNGIDTQLWQPRPTFDDAEHSVLRDHGIKPDQPIVAFVGRITHQKGVEHLVKAARHFSPGVQLVLCAGAPDTPEIAARTQHLVEELQAEREGVVWVQEMLSKDKIQEILTAADAFVCPSIYEPLGIVNLEAMACATAVVASDVGGIPEVVVDGTTGSLVHYDPNDTDTFEHDLAEAVNAMVTDRKRAAAFGVTGRNRAVSEFSWGSIAQQTVDVYSSLL